jgi:uncharacterized membrane protein (DUF485 family)
MTETAAVTRLAARRWRLALALTAAMLAVYLGFILLIAFAKPVLATRLTGGLTLGITLGVLVIVLAWVLTWTYVRWANRVYDPALRDLSAPAREGGR